MAKEKLKIFLLVLGLIFYSCENNLESPVLVNPNLESNSKVIVELFSNVMCVACVQSANYCDDISFLRGVTINDTNVIIINIHSSLFPGDPFHAFNPQMNISRENYYYVLFNPSGYLMGSLMTTPFSSEQWTNQINQRLSKTNVYSIILSNTIDTVSRTGSLNMVAGQMSGQSHGDLKLLVVITESNLYFNSPNGKTNYNNILRQMLTDYSGENVIISPGQPLNLIKEYALDNRIQINNSQIIVFIQNNLTKEILGAEKIKLIQ